MYIYKHQIYRVLANPKYVPCRSYVSCAQAKVTLFYVCAGQYMCVCACRNKAHIYVAACLVAATDCLKQNSHF